MEKHLSPNDDIMLVGGLGVILQRMKYSISGRIPR